MESSELLTTNRKALTVNLDEAKYGTFAEIGAGQEVARQFFQAGGAAGTIAKSISAYDMKFSDAIYGKGIRYVSRERLGIMLDYEYELLIERLNAVRGDRTAFFVFADTVAAKSFKGFRHLGFRQRKPRPLIAHADPLLQEAHKKTSKAGRSARRRPLGSG